MAELTIEADADTSNNKAVPADTSGGTNTEILTRGGGTFDRNAILKFDFSAIGAGIITAASLKLTKNNEGGGACTANRLTETGWVEAQVSWDDYATSTAWATAGGDFTGVDSVGFTAPGPSGNTVTMSVLTQVEYARDNVSDVAHFLINQSSSNFINFRSKEHATPADRPQLIITYTPPTVEASLNLPILNVQAAGAAGAELTFPSLEVQAFGASGADLTFPVLSVSAFSGALSTVTLPSMSLSAEAHLPADIALTLPVITLFAVPPPSTITLPALSVSAEVSTRANFDESFPSLSLSATGNALRGVIQITLPQFTTTFSGFTGSVDGTTLTLPAFTVSIRTGLTSSHLLPQFVLNATAQVGAVGTYNKSLPRMIVNVKATQQSSGINSVTLPMLTLDATLKTGEISLTSTRNLPGLRLGATAFVGEAPGDVDLTFPAFELATFGYQSITGTVVQSLKMLTLNAYGDSYTNRII